MRPQDIVILIKKLTPIGLKMNGKQLAESLHISASEVSEALDRNRLAGLIDISKNAVNTLALREFLIYGLRYCFPIVPGGLVRGIPTGISASPYSDTFVSGEASFVWPFAEGQSRGQAIDPLFPSVPRAVNQDVDFYKLMATIDVLRMGRVRERELAIKELDYYIDQYVKQQPAN